MIEYLSPKRAHEAAWKSTEHQGRVLPSYEVSDDEARYYIKIGRPDADNFFGRQQPSRIKA